MCCFARAKDISEGLADDDLGVVLKLAIAPKDKHPALSSPAYRLLGHDMVHTGISLTILGCPIDGLYVRTMSVRSSDAGAPNELGRAIQ